MNEVEMQSIGMTIKNMSNSDRETYKVESGILITDVKLYSKAYNQRLQKGLVITEIDRKKIDTVSDFENIVNSKKGSAVLLKVADSRGNTSFIGLEIPE